jgi:DNA-3-methyladenine glycosylase
VTSECGGHTTGGRIVETEAYPGPDDPACHAASRIGRTRRNAPLYGPPGTAYIHMNYGIHWLMNVVTGREGFPAGVLIRALEPLDGVDVMRSRRGRDELTNGPARVTQALAVGPEVQSHRLDRSPLWFSAGDPVSDRDVETTTRIGISQAVDRPLRYYDCRSEWISKR